MTVDIVPGDIEGSLLTDIADILDWLNFLGAATTAVPPLYADVDGSGLTDIADVNAIILANGAASTPLAAPLADRVFENLVSTPTKETIARDVDITNLRKTPWSKRSHMRRSLSHQDASSSTTLDSLFAGLATKLNDNI